MMKIRQAEDTDKPLSQLLERYEKEVLDRIPYRVNLVDILGANENAHTRILTAILSFERNGEKPFAKSFVARFVCNDKGQPLVRVQNPKIETQQRYIDALIWEKANYAIVIENKINWAADQQGQIEGYIKATKAICGINPSEQCFVIYLTDDGRKTVEEYSLTEVARKYLGYKDQDELERYFALNYKEDILPWLKEEVLPNCPYGEKTFVAMLCQYIDYLDHRFSIENGSEQSLFWRFVQKLLKKTDFDRFAGLIKWSSYCAQQGENDIPENQRYTLQNFSAQVQKAIREMIRSNYSLSFSDAAVIKGETVRTWATANGFHPHKYYNSTFFEFRIQPYNERIKFQINIDNASNEVWVQFFNNDFVDDGKHATIHRFESLFGSFCQLFPDIDRDDSTDWAMHSLLGVFHSEKELVAALNGPIKDFLEVFNQTFIR